tara:strand:- start:201 stop:917 length:717 start_codon:yes stop_codon:yes gene_type:complete
MQFSYSTYKIDYTIEEYPEKRYFFTLALINASLSKLEKNAVSFLHPDERKELNSYTYNMRRHSFLLGRCAAKIAFNSYNACQTLESSFQVRNTLMGSPYFLNKQNHLSLSHSGDYGLAMVGERDHSFAVDIEIKNSSNHLSKEAFEPDEQKWLQCFDWSQDEVMLGLWSIKEALVKLIQTGLTVSMVTLEVKEVTQENKNRLKVKFKHFHSITGWIIKKENYILSICLPSKINPCCWN